MRLIDAKIICRLYALGLAALAASLAVLFSGSIAAAGLLAVAVGLALLHQWAFMPAYAVPLLYICETIADALRVRWLRPSGVMPGVLGNRFRFNVVVSHLFDRPAKFFEWYGVPEYVFKILLCVTAITALAYAHQRLRKNAQFRQFRSYREKVLYARILARISKVVVALSLLIIVIAVLKDPPIGGRNPGGPGPGTSLMFAIYRAGPWLLIGSIGWAATAWLIRKNVPAATPEGSGNDRPSL